MSEPSSASAPHGLLDKKLVRRRFALAARTYAGASRVETEVASRMLERLAYVKLAPRRILDAGSGAARDAAALKRRYPDAALLAVDSAFAVLPTKDLLGRILRRAPLAVCGDMERLPFAGGSFGLAWSNMALHWLADPLAALRELERVLAPEGLVMFSTFGPDTLKELRVAAGATRVHDFADMHDLGDMLVAAGFSAPVMDMEMLRVEYATGERLLDDLRASGQTNARRDRARGLAGRSWRARLGRALGGPRHFTYELVYGHAWKRASRPDEPPAARADDAPAKSIRIFKRVP